jgi:hypothetical protein
MKTLGFIFRYSGQIKQNKLQGFGQLIWIDGTRFEGAFENGLIDGEGCFSELDKEKRVGTVRIWLILCSFSSYPL